MNKEQFINHIAKLPEYAKVEAEEVIDIFTSSVIDTVSKGNDRL